RRSRTCAGSCAGNLSISRNHTPPFTPFRARSTGDRSTPRVPPRGLQFTEFTGSLLTAAVSKAKLSLLESIRGPDKVAIGGTSDLVPLASVAALKNVACRSFGRTNNDRPAGFVSWTPRLYGSAWPTAPVYARRCSHGLPREGQAHASRPWRLHRRFPEASGGLRPGRGVCKFRRRPPPMAGSPSRALC